MRTKEQAAREVVDLIVRDVAARVGFEIVWSEMSRDEQRAMVEELVDKVWRVI